MSDAPNPGRAPGRKTAETRPAGLAGEVYDIWRSTGLTQERLAELCGRSRATLYRWCSGKSQPSRRAVDHLRERVEGG